MNAIQRGILLVLFVIVETISGLTPGKSVISNHTQDLPATHIETDKSQDIGVTDTLKIITDETTTAKTATTTTSTTIPPSTTTTTTSTSTIPPTPTSPPAPNNYPWVIRNSTTNTVCVIVDVSMQINITYPAKNNSLVSGLINIPKNATVNGTCGEPTQTMHIYWGPDSELRINFSANKTSKNFYISEISLSVNATVFKDAKAKDAIWHFENKSTEFITPLEMSYKCSKVQDLDLKSEDDTLKAVLSMKDTQFEAFNNKNSTSFEAAQNCEMFDTPDIVPIAVGCALAILVLVVLVAYLIGRKRSQNRGYLSM